MKRLTLSIFIIIAIVSCKKDTPSIKYTSDVPNTFETDLRANYDQNENLTTVRVSFSGRTDNYSKSVILPSNSYFEYNGQQLQLGDYYSYHSEFIGNENAVINFKNFDEKLYSTGFSVPDTAYFVNLPDTVSVDQDLTLYFGGPALAYKENWGVSFLGRSFHSCDDGYYSASTKENSVTILKDHFEAGHSYPITLSRGKSVDCATLPGGGGSIIYRYTLTKTVYFE